MGEQTSLRADKWLWYARFFKTRGLCAKLISEGKLRINQARVSKPSVTIKIGDVLTFAQEKDIRVIEVKALGERRGPAPEAQTLYSDLSPVVPKPKSVPQNPSYQGKGRPTGKDRRTLSAFSTKHLE